MRIAFNTLIENPFKPSGSTDFYRKIIREFGRLDKNNEFYVLVSRANRHLFRNSNENIHLVDCFVGNEKPIVRILLSQFVIPFRLREKNVDILFSPQNISAFFVPKRINHIVSIVTTHHWVIPESIGIIRSLYRKVASYVAEKRASIILANSITTRELILQNMKVAPEKVRVIYEGLDHSLFFRGPVSEKTELSFSRLGLRKPFILFVSTLWSYKNVHGLLEAFGLLCRNSSMSHHLAIIGRNYDIEGARRNYMNSLKRICERYGNEHRVHFIGYVKNEHIPDFYRSADLFIQPSLHETFGKTVIEAFACGTPVIASNTGATPEIVGDAGLLFNPYSPHEIVEVMERALSDHELKKSLMKKGIQRAKDFSYEKQARELLSLFHEFE